MKLKNVLLSVGLSLGAIACASLTVNPNQKTIESKADGEHYSRVNVLTANNYWSTANATTMLHFSNIQHVWASKDADIGDTVTIGQTTYTLYTCLVDINNVGNYDDICFQRYNSDGTEYWNWEIWGGWPQDVGQLNKNTYEINSNGAINEWGDKWWKVVTYSGVDSYENLSSASKTANLVVHDATIPDPTSEAPANKHFASWYTDPELSHAWHGVVQSDLTLYAKYADTTYTVTKEIYKDDELIDSETDTVGKGDNYDLGDPASIAGYIFDGWYTRVNDGWGQKITSISNVTADQTVGARYRSRAQYAADSYIYYVADLLDGTTMTPNYIYTYGGNSEFGGWPGTKISDLADKDLHGSLGFRGWADWGYNRCIFRIPFTSDFNDTHVILNAGSDSDKSADLLIVSGSAYYWGGKDDDAGSAIDFLLMAEGFRIDVDASTGILDNSVCGIDPSDAADIYGEYEKLSSTAQGYVCDSYVYTYTGKYDGVTVPGEGSVDYEAVMAEILTIALKDTKFKEDHPTLGTSPIIFDSENSGLIIAVTAFAAILATGGFFFLRRRKEN